MGSEENERAEGKRGELDLRKRRNGRGCSEEEYGGCKGLYDRGREILLHAQRLHSENATGTDTGPGVASLQ